MLNLLILSGTNYKCINRQFIIKIFAVILLFSFLSSSNLGYSFAQSYVFKDKWGSFGIELGNFINYGASPRATIYLAVAAKAHAFIQQRGYVTPQDVKSIGLDVLRHRVIVSYEAEAEDKTSEDIIKTIFDNIEVP